MSRGYVSMLLLLAALWGASYMFIKVAVRDIEPTTMMSARALLAGILLTGYVVVTTGRRRALGDLRAAWRPSFVLGVLNAALPFALIAWGEKHIDSSVAAVAQSSVPLFAFVIGLRFLPHERIEPSRWVGVAVGLAGVAALVGLNPSGGWWAVAGTFAIVLSSVCYASSGIYAQLRVHATPGPVLAAGSMLAGGLILMPLGIAQAPADMPGVKALAAVLGLTLLGTFVAQLVYFRMLPPYGARRITLVAYLIPLFAIFYGAVFLSEPLTSGMVVGLALILGGVALGSGYLRWRRDAVAEDAA